MDVDLKPNKYGKYQCPCCGYYTHYEVTGNTFAICDVCYWEDDGIQLDDPAYEGGANYISLNDARENFKRVGCCEERLVSYCRKPAEQDMPD